MDKLYRYGWLFMIIAMAGDIIVSMILPLFYRNYDWMKMSISALGNPESPVRLPFNVWMLIEGILFSKDAKDAILASSEEDGGNELEELLDQSRDSVFGL